MNEFENMELERIYRRMQDYKFRGQESSTGGWVYGFFAIRYVPWVNAQFTERIGTVESPYIIQTEEGAEPRWIPVFPKTLGQYTGLKDKNGREIYDGDVVLGCYKGATETWRVCFGSGCFRADCSRIRCCTDLNDIAFDCKVIGNIHDNPELINNK